MVVVVTGGEQSSNYISDSVKREITQGLVEGHGADKGIAVAGTCVLYDFETCDGIDISSQRVRCMTC